MKIVVGILVCLMTACSDQADVRGDSAEIKGPWDPIECLWSQTSSIARFTTQCIKNGNPMSDEDPEDLVNMCRLTASKIYCPSGRYKFFNGIWSTYL